MPDREDAEQIPGPGQLLARRRRLRRHKAPNLALILTPAELRKLRPSRHWLVLAIMTGFSIVSVVQILRGPSPDSVNIALPVVVQTVLAVVAVAGAVLNLLAAAIPSDKVALACEAGGMALLCAAFSVYAGIIVATIPQWYATSSAAYSLALSGGTFARIVQILQRGW